MKTKTYNVYSFAELSRSAKARAIYEARAILGYPWEREAMKSLEALAGHFGGKLADYSVDWAACSHSSARFDMPDLEPEEIEARMATLGTYDPATLKGHGDCKLTGYGTDEDAIDGFRAAWHAGERDLSALMSAAFKTWLEAAQADCADMYSEERFAETSDANEYEFTEDGKLD